MKVKNYQNYNKMKNYKEKVYKEQQYKMNQKVGNLNILLQK